MKRFSFILALLLFCTISQTIYSQIDVAPVVAVKENNSESKIISVEKVANDPLNAIIYTLDNGLKVYMSVNKDEPRIQTYIAVRVGSKNDPKENTGLAHYFEHLMFKGTKSFGTIAWDKEEPIIKQIEELYEVYGKETNKEKRDEIYRQIDELSFKASKYAIPNEYDKLMTLIGAQGTNAATSNDFTFYVENIPSNQIENWARIQADRFQNPILRLFHTELETVYEEKNMSLTNDRRKANEAMMAALYPNHPYGQQTTLGTSEHLRNPSMVAINNYFKKHYVPNNYCIAMSGDFDPEQAIKIIQKHFGTIPSKEIEPFKFEYEKPITEPKIVDVVGLEAENLIIAFRINAGSTSREVMLANLLDAVMNNGSTGIIDVNVRQRQLAQSASSSVYDLNDYAAFTIRATPKTGQGLDDLKELMLKQIDQLVRGDWDEDILKAAINNLRLSEMRQLENNRSRAMKMVYSYLSGEDWSKTVEMLDNMQKVTKDELLKFAKEIFKENNYVLVRKLQGEAQNIEKVEKPPITPIHINREAKSELFKEIESNNVKPIEPKFLDYTKDLSQAKLNNGANILYVQNKENGRFSLTIRYDYGRLSNKRLGLLRSYQAYITSQNKSLQDLEKEFYNIACRFTISSGDDYSEARLEGLSDNFDKALVLFEEVLSNPNIEQESVTNMVKTILKQRNDAKKSQQSCFSALNNYVVYGKEQAFSDFIPEKELLSITPQMLINDLKEITKYSQEIWYYGSLSLNDLQKTLNKKHNSSPKNLKVKPKVKLEEKLPTKENKVYFVNYDAKQSYCRQFTTGGVFDDNLSAPIMLYNEYFGGSMNAIVFQEMREKRSLAYQAQARYIVPSRLGMKYQNMSHIATQNDKVITAFEAFNELFDNMPISQANFNLAKESLISAFRTNRSTKEAIIYSYVQDRLKGRKTDISETLYNKLPSMTINDVVSFNNQYIKNQKRVYTILGNKAQVDIKALERFGKVQVLSLEDIFGY
jgi:predicted Zn-dependent peptidase